MSLLDNTLRGKLEMDKVCAAVVMLRSWRRGSDVFTEATMRRGAESVGQAIKQWRDVVDDRLPGFLGLLEWDGIGVFLWKVPPMGSPFSFTHWRPTDPAIPTRACVGICRSWTLLPISASIWAGCRGN
jgi:hypothetical protein